MLQGITTARSCSWHPKVALVRYLNESGAQIRGHRPKGFIYYDRSGNMAVQIMPDWERPNFSLGKATPDQAKSALDGYSAYFGTYSVDEEKAIVTHRREGNINPGDMGDFVREIEFQEPNKLILKTRGTSNRIIWERASDLRL